MTSEPLSAIIISVATLIASIGSVIAIVLNGWKRDRQMESAAIKMEQVHKTTNGMSKRMEDAQYNLGVADEKLAKAETKEKLQR